MRLLLDTHIFLWWRADAPDPGANVRAALLDPANEILVSAVVVWEIVIKRALGRLDFDGPVVAAVAEEGFTPLPVTLAHADEDARLANHHRDPFDRHLVAPARLESLVLVTHDALVRNCEGVVFLPA